MDMIKLLIENGADRFAKDNNGLSANDYGLAQMEIREYFESLDKESSQNN